MIAIAYFHYDTLRSDISVFEGKDDAKKWLFEKCGWILDDGMNPTSLEELISELSDKNVTVNLAIYYDINNEIIITNKK